MIEQKFPEPKKSFREILRERIFDGNTAEGRFFEIFLSIVIILSVIFVILENSEPGATGKFLIIEWTFTVIFTIEYILRVYASHPATKYPFSFFGIIDLVSILPLYLMLFISVGSMLQLIRLLRLIRAFSRIVKLSHRINELSMTALSLEHHLLSGETKHKFFRPSRKKMILEYSIITILMAVSLYLVFFLPEQWMLGRVSFTLILGIFFLTIGFFVLVRTEYRVWSERFMITNVRVCHSKGIFNEHFKSVMFQYVTDISLKQSIWDKILNTGTVIVSSSSGTDDNLLIKDISHPVDVKRILGEYIRHVQASRTMNVKR